MAYNKPVATSIETNELCDYGCMQIAKYKFANNKLCCSTSFNSCPKKRKDFSNRTDHKETAAKSLKTRIELGITKSTNIKAHATMLAKGINDIRRVKMQERWARQPWQNNLQCPLIPYKDTTINYQGSHEFKFLEELELEYGIGWLSLNVQRGPSLWYVDPTTNTKRLYISDFLINNTIYEIKSSWTWNKYGKDLKLEEKNKAKLTQCIVNGYNVKLILDNKEEIQWQ